MHLQTTDYSVSITITFNVERAKPNNDNEIIVALFRVHDCAMDSSTVTVHGRTITLQIQSQIRCKVIVYLSGELGHSLQGC